MNKKGLAVIYDPQSLYQFLWYYCRRGEKKEWDALCLPNGHKGEYMSSFCRAAGIFCTVYRGSTDYFLLSTLQKMKLFLQMVCFFLVGKKKKMCRRIIGKYVNVNDYDEYVVIADVGVVSGACVALGYDNLVVILEDGINDYTDRPVFVPKKKIKSVYAWQGFFLSVMGYCSPSWYRFGADKYCIKYCSHPSKMKYRNYREIRQLYDENETDMKLLDVIVKRIYPAIDKYDFSGADIILMTRPFDDFVVDDLEYIHCVEKYINNTGYNKIIIKNHPREKRSYNFDKSINITEVDSDIPAQALLPYFRGKTIYVVSMTGPMLCMKVYDIHCIIIIPEGLYEESMRTNSIAKPYSLEEIKDYCNCFLEGHYEIISI